MFSLSRVHGALGDGGQNYKSLTFIKHTLKRAYGALVRSRFASFSASHSDSCQLLSRDRHVLEAPVHTLRQLRCLLEASGLAATMDGIHECRLLSLFAASSKR